MILTTRSLFIRREPIEPFGDARSKSLVMRWIQFAGPGNESHTTANAQLERGGDNEGIERLGSKREAYRFHSGFGIVNLLLMSEQREVNNS